MDATSLKLDVTEVINRRGERCVMQTLLPLWPMELLWKPCTANAYNALADLIDEYQIVIGTHHLLEKLNCKGLLFHFKALTVQR